MAEQTFVTAAAAAACAAGPAGVWSSGWLHCRAVLPGEWGCGHLPDPRSVLAAVPRHHDDAVFFPSALRLKTRQLPISFALLLPRAQACKHPSAAALPPAGSQPTICTVSRLRLVANLQLRAGAAVVAVCPAEEPFELEGPSGVIAYLQGLLEQKGHAVICVSEGAGQNLLYPGAYMC